ncbi:hypothetical protein HPB51_029150 [Rhipicephalus microplus]|uniref:Uncharacterized protein n=1 Tax=Rhipicephalus microplus TaxID=6941 RepID=A0A9J6CVQ1_RHIMP|nr:hypothetical protein HPB51_029150 [Rhipicephalus microplus]
MGDVFAAIETGAHVVKASGCTKCSENGQWHWALRQVERCVSEAARYWWSGQEERRCVCVAGRNTGNIRRDCRVPMCASCRVLGHGQVGCTRSYASAASRATNADHTESLMDEEAAEKAAASQAAVEASHAVATSVKEMETPKQDTDENTVMGTPTQPRLIRTETQHKPESVIGPDATSEMDTVETTSEKRRLNEGHATSQPRLTQEDQGQWRAAGSKKFRGAGRLRSSSLSRGGNGTTP